MSSEPLGTFRSTRFIDRARQVPGNGRHLLHTLLPFVTRVRDISRAQMLVEQRPTGGRSEDITDSHAYN